MVEARRQSFSREFADWFLLREIRLVSFRCGAYLNGSALLFCAEKHARQVSVPIRNRARCKPSARRYKSRLKMQAPQALPPRGSLHELQGEATMQLVSVSAFPKSGVTYLSSLLFYTLFGDANATEIESRYIVDIHVNDLSNAYSYDDFAFYKNHFAYDIRNMYCTSAAKVIYLVRDPIDIMRSAYDYRSLVGDKSEALTLDTFARDWIASQGNYFEVAGPWPRHVTSWIEQADRPVHLVRYQDLVDEPAEQVASICTFLGLVPPPSSIDRAVLNSTMGAMRAREEAEFRARRPGVFYSEGVAQGMADGARFVNKGYRRSYDELGAVEKRLVDDQFGAVRARYLA